MENDVFDFTKQKLTDFNRERHTTFLYTIENLPYWLSFLVDEIEEAIQALKQSHEINDILLEFADVYILFMHVLFSINFTFSIESPNVDLPESFRQQVDALTEEEIDTFMLDFLQDMRAMFKRDGYRHKVKVRSGRRRDYFNLRNKYKRNATIARYRRYSNRDFLPKVIESLNAQVSLYQVKFLYLVKRFLQLKHVKDLNFKNFLDSKFERNRVKFRPGFFETLRSCKDRVSCIERYLDALRISRKYWGRNNSKRDEEYIRHNKRGDICTLKHIYTYPPFYNVIFEVHVPDDKKILLDKSLQDFIDFVLKELRRLFSNILINSLNMNVPFAFERSSLHGTITLTLTLEEEKKPYKVVNTEPQEPSRIRSIQFHKIEPEDFVFFSVIEELFDLIEKNLERFLTSRAQT